MRRYCAIMGVSCVSAAIGPTLASNPLEVETKKEQRGKCLKRDWRSRKRDHCFSRQVLTPRTKISNPALGLRAYCLATTSLLLRLAPFNFFQTKVIHSLFTISKGVSEKSDTDSQPQVCSTAFSRLLRRTSPTLES